MQEIEFLFTKFPVREFKHSHTLLPTNLHQIGLVVNLYVVTVGNPKELFVVNWYFEEICVGSAIIELYLKSPRFPSVSQQVYDLLGRIAAGQRMLWFGKDCLPSFKLES